MSPKLQRNVIAVVLVVASLGIGYGLRSAFPPYEVITTPVVIDEALWRAMISGPPMAGVFAVFAAAIAFTPAILSTRIARENAAREQWWNRAEWALGLASSSDEDDRAVANDALKALSEVATATEYKMIYLTMKNLQRPPAIDTPVAEADNGIRERVITWLDSIARRTQGAS